MKGEIEKMMTEFHFEKVFAYSGLFAKGVGTTLYITVISVIIGLLLAILLALMKISKSKILRGIGYIYTDIFRGLPALVQLYLIYFAIPALTGVALNVMTAAIITLSMNSAAYVSEAIRGGVESIDIGQMEAAKSLGVGYVRTMKDIILPQAIRTILPALVNEAAGQLKGTSLVSIIGVTDLMRVGRQVMSDTFLSFEPLIVVGIIYYVLTKILSVCGGVLEKRLAVSVRK